MITEKDVYGHELTLQFPILPANNFDEIRGRIAGRIQRPAGRWKVKPKPGYYIDQRTQKIKPLKTTTIMKELKTYWTVLKGAAVVLFAGAVCVTVAKIVVTYTNWVWNLW